MPVTSKLETPRYGKGQGGLLLVRELVHALEKEKVRYCHFKSNEHLDAALQGLTDLDVLFDEAQKECVEKVVASCGFFRGEPVAIRKYPGIYDYLGIDRTTGRVVHIHAHFLLLSGTTGVKEYRLPWEEAILTNRVWNEEHQFYCSDPESEIVLLLVRGAVKLTPWAIAHVASGTACLDADLVREFDWLLERCNEKTVLIRAKELVGDTAAAAVIEILRAGLSKKRLFRLRAALQKPLRSSRRFGPTETRLRQVAIFGYRVARKLSIGDVPTLRIVARPGPIIAVLGADGVGKTTQTIEVTRELARKLDVVRIYMGAGKGKTSLLRFPLLVIRRAAFEIFNRRARSSGYSNADIQRKKDDLNNGLLGVIFNVFWAIAVAREKSANLTRMRRCSARGLIVICDRFPQVDTDGYSDGPLLAR